MKDITIRTELMSEFKESSFEHIERVPAEIMNYKKAKYINYISYKVTIPH